jgi:rare lipoprotein A
MLSISTSRAARNLGWTTSIFVLLATVAGSVSPASPGVHRQEKQKPEASHVWTQVGRASWYGRRTFQGRLTASGEPFDRTLLTCAHPTLPIGSLVKVTNLTNHRSIMVRVNDRGPIIPGRIVDLSYAAAHALGFRREGVARVRLERIEGAEMAQVDWPEANRDAATTTSH